MRMRALDRWSAVSFATTAQRPVQGEPRRRASGRLLSGMPGLLEIAGVDFVEARRGEIDADQLDLGGETARDLGSQIARAIDPIPLAAERLPPHHAGYRGEPPCDARAARLDIDDIAAAEHLPRQVRPRARQPCTGAAGP